VRFVKRKIFDDVIKWLEDKRIIIIKGARRTGKTTLINQIKDYLQEHGKKAVLFSADQELDSAFFKNSRLFWKFLSDQYLQGEERLYCLIDECQYLPGAPLFLKTLHDMASDKLKLVVTGSSSLDLLKTKEPLTGRKIDFTLERFSFSEYLDFSSQYAYQEQFSIPGDMGPLQEFHELYGRDLEYHFVQYINWGGYPEVCMEKEIERKKSYLKEIIQSYVEKDVSQFFRIGDVSKFNALARLLCHQRSRLLNRSEVSNTLGLHSRTLENYLNILEGTFIITLLRPFYRNIRKELSKMPKVFVNDAGIIRYYTGTVFSDFNLVDGSLAENFVFGQLSTKRDLELFYYRTISKSEIDFIIRKGTRLIPVEVKFKKKMSIPVAMKNFFSNYSQEAEYGVVVTKDLIGRTRDVYFLPVVLLDFVIF